MTTDITLAYVKKAKQLGTRVLIVSEDPKIELTHALETAGLKVRHIETENIVLHLTPEHREPLVWAHTVIFFGTTVQVSSSVAFNLLSLNDLSENIPYEKYNGTSWKQVSHAKLPSFKYLVDCWKELHEVWPELLRSEHAEKIGLLYAGPENGISIGHMCVSELVEYVNLLRKQGTTRFLCYNLMETAQTDGLLRVQLLATAMPEIDPAHFIYVTSAANMQTPWQDFCDKNQIDTPISIMSGNWYDLTWWNTTWMPLDATVEVPDFDPEYIPPKTFLCFNNVARWHRTKLVTELVHNNLLKDGLVSLRNNKAIHSAQLGLEKTRPDATKWLIDNLPLHIDEGLVRNRHIAFPDDNDTLLHTNTSFSLVTETIYQSDNDEPRDGTSDFVRGGIFFTEKTYKPIWFKQAFIVVAVPGFLKYLKSIGWQTFAPYIDESYDNETDDDKRMQLIVKEVKRLNSFTDEEWRQWRRGIAPVIDANARRIRREHSGELTTSQWKTLF